MSDSLRDQLLKAGLVDEKKLRQSRQEKKNHGRKQKVGKGAAPAGHHGGSTAEQARRRQAERSRELNRSQQEAAARKALAAQIRQIIETHRVARDDGELAYHFQHANKVRRIHVSRDQQERLTRGQLGIVTLSGGYELLPRDALEKVRERDAARVVLCNEPGAETRSPAEDDPYADYEIPNDLMW
jgi:uncharacterized protein